MYDGLGGRRGFVVQPPVGEKRIFNWMNEYLIPLAQNATIGVLFAHVVVSSPIIVLLCAGKAAFQVFAGFAMLYVFVKYWIRSSQFVTEDGEPIAEVYEESLCNSVAWVEIALGAALSLTIGGAAKLLYDGVAILGLAIPNLNSWIAIAGIAQFPMSAMMLLFALLSFGQELIQRSPWMEQFGWKAIFSIVEGLGNKAVQMRQYVHPPTINYRGKTINDKPATITPRQTQTPEAIEAAALVEFIRKGAQIGYARGSWTSGAGIILEATGQKMRVSQWVRFTEGLKKANIMGESGAGNATSLLCSAEEAIAHVSHPSFSLE